MHSAACFLKPSSCPGRTVKCAKTSNAISPPSRAMRPDDIRLLMSSRRRVFRPQPARKVPNENRLTTREDLVGRHANAERSAKHENLLPCQNGQGERKCRTTVDKVALTLSPLAFPVECHLTADDPTS